MSTSRTTLARTFVSGTALTASLANPALPATTYYVGPMRTHTTLQSVAPLLGPGDLVLVDGDHTYLGHVIFNNPGTSTQRIVIRGVRVNGRRPVLSADTLDVVKFRTANPGVAPGADYYTFEGFEISGGDSARGINHQADSLIISDVVVHHCTDGILGAMEGSGSCLLEYSEIYACGRSPKFHQIYMDTDEANHPRSIFRMQFCYLHDATGGHNVKSRAERNEIYYNWIEGAYEQELDLVGSGLGVREDSDVVGNVLKKTGTTPGYIARIGGDPDGISLGRYRFVNNTVIYNYRVFKADPVLESSEMHNNVFYQVGAAFPKMFVDAANSWSQGRKVAGKNNWYQNGVDMVPPEWRDSLVGTNPIFRDATHGDLVPGSSSPLLNAGTETPTGPAGFPSVPDALFPPMYSPPAETLYAVGIRIPRVDDVAIDIGAYEVPCCVDVPRSLGTSAELAPPVPNPLRTETLLRFAVARPGPVVLSMLDISGRSVGVVAAGIYAAGSYAVPWRPKGLAAGVYWARLTTPQGSETKRIVLLR